MPITIDGDGTITGVSVGGLPDGVVDADMLAANAVTTAKISNGQITTAKISDGQITEAKLASDPQQGVAKAWVNFDASGTPSIRDNFNVSSITDHGTGDYAANYSTAMPNANYCVTGLTQNSNNYLAINSEDSSNPNTAYIRIAIRNHDGTFEDGDVVCVCVHGD